MTIRVLTISKPYVAAAYRSKLNWLARETDLTIGLICPPAWGSQRFEPAPLEQPDRFWLKVLPIVANGKNHFHFYRNLAAAIDSFQPDVLNIEEEHYSIVTAQAVWIAHQRGIPAAFYTWQNVAKNYPPPFSWIERFVFRHCAWGFIGNEEAGQILRNKGYKGQLCYAPQMGVEYDRFVPQDPAPQKRRERLQQLQLDPQKIWIAFIGRVVEEKGVQDLLRALKLANTNDQFRVLIVGDGPYRAQLQQLAQELGLTSQVHFIASVPSTQVPLYLQAVDAMCLPSLTRSNWKEQFGRIIVEAMAAQCVVIGSSSGEIPTVIQDAGLVFQEGHPEDLARCLQQLAIDSDTLTTIKAKATQRVRTHFTNEVLAQKFAHVFRCMAQSR